MLVTVIFIFEKKRFVLTPYSSSSPMWDNLKPGFTSLCASLCFQVSGLRCYYIIYCFCVRHFVCLTCFCIFQSYSISSFYTELSVSLQFFFSGRVCHKLSYSYFISQWDFSKSEISRQIESVSSQPVHVFCWRLFHLHSQKFVQFPQVYSSFLAN